MVFNKYDSQALKKTINQAINTYGNQPAAWNKLVKTGMKADYSWEVSAKKYANLYKTLVA